MNKEVFLIVEGYTELAFVREVLGPYMAQRGLYFRPTLIGSIGRKGGDVRFERVKPQIKLALKQRGDTLVGTLFDYYGLKRWPMLDEVRTMPNHDSKVICETLVEAAIIEIEQELPSIPVRKRFVPFLAVHEFEAFLFSDPQTLSVSSGIPLEKICNALAECGNSPERIDNGAETAPSKRLEAWTNRQYGKTTTGIAVAERIGIEAMRSACPNFDLWIRRLQEAATQLEDLAYA